MINAVHIYTVGKVKECFYMIIVVFQDPYFMKNHLGSYECKLCLTLHNNEVRSCIFFNMFDHGRPFSDLQNKVSISPVASSR